MLNDNPRTVYSVWKRYVLAVCLMMLTLMCSRKNVDPNPSGLVGEVYTVVDQPPAPVGGQTGLNTYLMQNLRYPAAAQRAGIQGKVIVGFVVTSTGKITDVQVTQSVGGGCDEEAVRVIKGMPDWIPGQKNEQAVNVRTSLPVLFTIL
ncbi:energy transducer TonB [Spirosoma sp. KUDC1026]|uniref:energy transducer TonB n=1 Tax=Spirosoma sp. KUDC1026 TaxID=2745947 RepID=UPI00159B9D3D|nr:energy transducer TonB [Spirosoma sp. KUDC1026]QKZ15398.1 energy transducer TonB [Spirosoma sp. KUDC1026]